MMPPSGDVYRVGLIGCGRIGSELDSIPPVPVTHAGAFATHPRARLVAGANRGRERLEAFGRKWGVSALYQDYHEMLDREALDIVCVATHPELHRDPVVAAADHRARAIFCEKPIALSLQDADDMIAACQRSGTVLAINHTRRWNAQWRKAVELVQTGAVGRLLRVVTHCLGDKPYPGWRVEEEGPLLHDGTHSFDALRMFAGDADWVMGTAVKRLQPYPVEDESLAIIRFKNGVSGLAVVDELTEYFQFDLEVVGSHGRIMLGDFGISYWGIKKSPNTEQGTDPSIEWWELDPRPFPAVETRPPLREAADDVINAIETGNPCRSTGQDGRAALELIAAIYESEARGGARVWLPLPSAPSPLHQMRAAGFYA
jgi:predicted dehydrogenase